MILLDQAGAGVAHTSLFAPPPALASLVEHAFVQQHGPGGWSVDWRVVPEAHAAILVAVETNPRGSRCLVVGPRSTFEDLSLVRRQATVGLRLQLGALPVITGLPASDFTNCAIPLSSLCGRAARILCSRLADEPTRDGISNALFDFVDAAVQGRSPRYHFSTFHAARRPVDFLERLGASRRSVFATLTREVGLAPRRLLRVERLERALRARASGVAWARVAAAAGYADQAHLAREAKELLGETPTAWSRRAIVPDRSIPQSV